MRSAGETTAADVMFVDLAFATYELGRRFRAAWSVAPVLNAYELHLGFRYMVASLRQHGFRADIPFESGELGAVNQRDLIRTICTVKPMILGFTSYEGSIRKIMRFIERARAAGNRSLICLGGHLATFSADEFLSRFGEFIDVIVLGEGERAIVE
jgi:radical SAM superfamily enzyme YgiQ (UPF0313 family)